MATSCKVTVNRQLIDDHYVMTIALTHPIAKPLPGQFVMVMLKGRGGTLLGRPFSIYHYDDQGNNVTIDILYRTVGKGTRLMSKFREGDTLDIFGPHGKAFDIYPKANHVILIAGGVGVAPIAYLASHYKNNAHGADVKLSCYLGSKTANQLLGLDHLEKICSSINISTDDGSAGYHGMITEQFSHDATSFSPDQSVIYACGPTAMLKRLSEIVTKCSLTCQILLEQRMACGVGACLGCAVEVKKPGKINQYVRVCKDGPVFDIQDVNWDRPFI
jgi:dihydroorotate dehydrogenase electron transfer subunit